MRELSKAKGIVKMLIEGILEDGYDDSGSAVTLRPQHLITKLKS